MDNKELYQKIDEIISAHSGEKPIVAILQDIQEEYRYLPRESFDYLSEKLGVSLAKIYSIATFYENFSLTPKGKYVIKICDGTACHVRKSIPILEALRKELITARQENIRPLTADGMPPQRILSLTIWIRGIS